MENEDKMTFSLADDSDEEVVEEEVIDRDEEYEVDDDEEEEYDDYDDEEEYDDEDYDDEEDYEDDGYNDDYYDDRLNKVLDEIAEIKRGMQAPSTVVQQPQQPFMQPPIPQYIYQPQSPVPAAGSEVVMYNEISRLRDELAKNQSSLEMQKELSRIKEDVARDQKFAESQYNAEIKRLQDRIDDLLKNASSPQSEQSSQDSADLEGDKSLDIDKLLSINEAVLRAMRDTDSRIQNEIAQLRKQVEERPSMDDINRALSSVKKAVQNINTSGLNSDIASKLSDDIAALKEALASGMPATASAPVVVDGGGSDVVASELLRQLYEIKNVLGSSSAAAVKRTQTLCELVNDFKKVNYDVHSQNMGYKNKLASMYGFVKKLSECNEQDAVDLIQATNSLIEELAVAKVTREVFADIVAYSREIDDKSITSAMRESADKFYNITDKLKDAELDSVVDYISDLVAEKNVIQNNKKEKDNNKLLTEITAELLEDERDEDAINEKIAALTLLKVSELIELPLIRLPKTYKATHAADDENIFSKLAELKAAVLDVRANAKSGTTVAETDKEKAEENDFVGEAVAEKEASDDDVAAILDAIDALESKLTATTGADGLPEAIEEIRNNYIDIAERLVDISEKIAVAPRAQASESAPALGMTEEEIGKTLDDLDHIKSKLDEHETFIRQIADLRADVLGMAGTVDNGEQSVFLGERFEGIINEIGAQCDKLYDDLSNALIDTENNIVTRTSESTVVTDAIADAKASILADTQAINESVVRLNDALGASPLGGAIEQLRADVLNLSDQAAINNETALIDRQKLLDDVAFIREQTEATLLEKNHSTQDEFDGEKASDELEKLYGYLDDISARIDVLSTVPEDALSAKDNIAVVLDTLLPMSDRLNEIIERMDAVEAQENADAEYVAEQEIQADPLDEDIARIKDDVATILDSLSLISQNQDVIAARDNTYTILDNISTLPQSADIVAIRDNINAILEAVQNQSNNAAVAEDVAAIRAALPEGLAEDITLVRDNTALVLDSLATFAQSQDDVRYIRQKLDENNSAESDNTVVDSLANIMNDIGIVLDKLEAFEQQAVNNKQEIVDTVSGIREEIHINELDENISASGIDDETRDLLVNEIAEIRERLNAIESTTQGISDVNATALDNISARLDELRNAVAAPTAEADDVVVQTLDDVNEKLNLLIDSLQGGAFDVIAADIADIKARLDGNVEDIAEGETGSPDSLRAIIDELNEIKEKLDSESEYDTVEEILSLRDDVKAARIVDQNEVSSELEAIKNELAAISSGTVLDEIRALRDDIAAISGGQSGKESDDSAPTDGELNLVLNEIVSLRDEVFALKDEVLNATGISAPIDEEQLGEVAGGDTVNSILDELADLREAHGVLTDSIEELKVAVSSKTTVATDAYGTDDAEAVAAQTGELSVVLDEINNLKSGIDGINDRISNESIDALSARIEELRDRIDAFAVSPSVEAHVDGGELDDIREKLDNIALNSSAVDFAALSDRLDEIGSVVKDLRLERENAELSEAAESGIVSGSLAENFESLRADIEDVKAAIATMAAPAVGDEIAELRAEIENLRAENEALRSSQNDALALELSELKNAVHDMTLSATPIAENGDISYAALIDEIKSLKEAVSVQSEITATPFADELGEIRDEIAQLRSLTTVTADRHGGQAEIAALRDELAGLKSSIASPDSMFGLAEDVTTIRADVQTLKEEPDLGVMNEILALRDEFQALREQIEDVKRIAAETDKQSDDNILSEVQSLRDQLFAISMANVNDSASGESNYESYNNIILDEIASIRDRIDASGSSEDIKAVTDEINQLKAMIDERDALYEDLAGKASRFDNDATNNKILEELTSLRTELANQRDADLTTLNFMSEMAHLLERQNSYIAQNTGSKISDEIESLKAEIASSDAVAEEVAKLREIMTQSGNASDNDTILSELADLREELSSEKPSRENELILQEISRLRDEITMIAERENVEKTTAATKVQNADALADSLSDLKDQLNEIAGIIEPEQKPKTTRRKSSSAKSGSKSTVKSGTRTSSGSKSGTSKSTMTKTSSSTTKSSSKKSGTGAKRGRKPASQKLNNPDTNAETVAPVQTVITSNEFTEESFDAKVNEEIKVLGGDAMSLNPNAPLPSTQDTMDVADKLAQQVANKLVIEQLVEQLGDDGMSEEQVDEILRELPIELTTKALDDQSDRVRKLANQLVLNKLRNRLDGKKPNND